MDNKVTRIESLTDGQRAMMPVYADKWIRIGLRTGEADWETFDEVMPICYEKAGLKYPTKVVRVLSPSAGDFVASISNHLLNNPKIKPIKSDELVYINRLPENIREAVIAGVREIVGEVSLEVINAAIPEMERHSSLDCQFAVGDYGPSVADIDFYREVCHLALDKDIEERADAYRRLCESVSMVWCNTDFVVVCGRPAVIKKVNLRDRDLHCADGPALVFPDGGNALYRLHGVSFPKELFEQVTSGTMPFKDILAIVDNDQRTQAMAFGDREEFLKYTKAELLSSYQKVAPNGVVVNYRLYKIPQGEIFQEDAYYTVYNCPSTGKIYMTGVDPMTDISEAMAWKISEEDGIKVTAEEWQAMIPLVDES